MNKIAKDAFNIMRNIISAHKKVVFDENGKHLTHGNTKENVYWCFSWDNGADEADCVNMGGWWIQEHKINRSNGFPNYHYPFLWRLHKKHYNAAGVPRDLKDEHSMMLYAGSETEKFLLEQNGISIYWTWKGWQDGGPNYWGHKMGETILEVRKDGQPIFATGPATDWRSYWRSEYELSDFLNSLEKGEIYVPNKILQLDAEEKELWKDLKRI